MDPKVGMRIREKQGGAAEKTIVNIDPPIRVIAKTDSGRLTRIGWAQLDRYETAAMEERRAAEREAGQHFVY